MYKNAKNFGISPALLISQKAVPRREIDSGCRRGVLSPPSRLWGLGEYREPQRGPRQRPGRANAEAETYVRAKFHFDPSNRLATIHQHYTRTDGQTDRTVL